MKQRLLKFFERYHDRPKSLSKGKYLFVFCALILTIVNWFVFYVCVNIDSITMAFQEFIGYDAKNREIYKWSFYNFKRFWSEMTAKGYAADSFLSALKNTIFLFITGNMVVLPLQYFTSYYLYKRYPGNSAFAWILYLPGIISAVVMVTIFKNIVEANGLISSISIGMGKGAVTQLLHSPKYAKWMVTVYNIFVGFAGSYIMLTAAMRRISVELIEAGQLDGANGWIEFWKIIFPGIFPTVQILLLGKVTGLLSADGPILLLTNGNYDTVTIGFWFYKQVILSHSFEYPSAIGLIMTAFVAPLALLFRKLTNKLYQE